MDNNPYYAYYMSQRGGDLPVYRGGLQSGAGLGSIFSSIGKFIRPLASRVFTPVLSKGMKVVLKTATKAIVPAIVPAIVSAAMQNSGATPAAASISPDAVAAINAATAHSAVAPGAHSAAAATASQVAGQVMFMGKNGIPLTNVPRRSAYKRAANTAKRVSNKRSRSIEYNF